MKTQECPPIWIILGIALLWIGLAVNVAYDYIVFHRVTPFSILFFLALLLGFILPKVFKWPVYTRQPSLPAIISLIVLFVVFIAYLLLKIFFS